MIIEAFLFDSLFRILLTWIGPRQFKSFDLPCFQNKKPGAALGLSWKALRFAWGQTCHTLAWVPWRHQRILKCFEFPVLMMSTMMSCIWFNRVHVSTRA